MQPRWGFNNLKDVLDVVAIPLTVAAAAALLGWWQSDAQLDATAEKAREDALQAYFDGMSQLMTGGKDGTGTTLRKAAYNSEERALARVRTLGVLRRMVETHADSTKNADRKRYVVRFLSESHLIDRDPPGDKEPYDEQASVYLYGAYLNGVNLSKIPLQRTNLRGATLADADLTDTNLSGADLTSADLSGATLTQVDLTGADLTGVTGVSNETLERAAKSLSDATMPDGTKHD